MTTNIKEIRAKKITVDHTLAVTSGITGNVTGALIAPVAAAPADAGIALTMGFVFITKSTAAALTLAAPAVADNGKQLSIISTTAAAHTVTQASAGFNGAGASGDVATFGAAIGNSITLVAYDQKWWVINLTGVTLG